MADILEFKAPQGEAVANVAVGVAVEDDEGEHAGTLIQGPALCIACKHEWTAVAECGDAVFDLVCPECDTRRGQFKYPIEDLPEDTIRWACGCGSTMFQLVYLDAQGYYAKGDDLAVINTSGGKSHTSNICCVGCGKAQSF